MTHDEMIAVIQAHKEAFVDYVDEMLTFAKDCDYAERLFDVVTAIYAKPKDDSHNDKLIQLIRTDTEGCIVSLLEGLKINTRRHFEEALRHPVPFAD